MLAGEGAGKRDDGSCWIKHGSRPGENGQSCDALGHFHSKNLWDGNRNSHQHRRQLLRCWNFHRVHHNHIHWSRLLQVLRNLWHLNMTFQGAGTSQQGCKRIIPWCNCDQIQRKQCWHLNNPSIQSKIFLFFTNTANFISTGGATRKIWCGSLPGDGRNPGKNNAVWKYDLVWDADDIAHKACMWSLRKGPKTQVSNQY